MLALALLGCKVPSKNNLPTEIALKDSAAAFNFYKSDNKMTDASRAVLGDGCMRMAFKKADFGINQKGNDSGRRD
jgi:hypothetical protein